MQLPANQDVIVDQCGWTGTGPLPTSDLEQGAWSLFMLDHADWQWDRVTTACRDDYRQRYLRLRSRVLKSERWTLSNMVDKLDAAFTQIVCGDRGPSAGEVKQLRDYAEACIEDLFRIFTGDERMAKGSTRSWKYVPEDEPDDSELEVIDPNPKKAVN